MRLEGDWEAWLQFFLEGIVETAEQATTTAHRVLAVLREDRGQIEASDRSTTSTRRLHEYLSRRPLTTIQKAADAQGVSYPTISTALRHLRELGIVNEGTTP